MEIKKAIFDGKYDKPKNTFAQMMVMKKSQVQV